MYCRSYNVCLLVAWMCLSASPIVTSARTLEVGSGGKSGFATIQAAVDAAIDGDVVVIQPGRYMGYGNCDIRLQRKAITVVAQEEGGGEEQRERLMVAVRIPDVITIEPELLQWAVGAPPEIKSFTFKVPHVDPVKIRKISCSREGFEFDLIEKKPGREYEIKLAPKSTDSPMLGVLKIETDCAIPKHQRKLAFFSIARQRRR